MNNPWETPEGKLIWKTRSQYFTWLRGALRQLWSSYPLRQEWKKQQLRKVTAVEREQKVFHPSTKNVGQCHYCNNWFAGSRLEVDHKGDSVSCNTKEEAEAFLWHCGGQVGSQWVLTCKPCHKIRNYSQLKNISFEQAAIEKKIIALMKDKKYVNSILTKHNLPCQNDRVRKESLRKLIEQNKLEE